MKLYWGKHMHYMEIIWCFVQLTWVPIDFNLRGIWDPLCRGYWGSPVIRYGNTKKLLSHPDSLHSLQFAMFLSLGKSVLQSFLNIAATPTSSLFLPRKKYFCDGPWSSTWRLLPFFFFLQMITNMKGETCFHHEVFCISISVFLCKQIFDSDCLYVKKK